MAVGALNYIVLTANGEHNTTTTSIVCNELVPTTGFPIMLVVASPFEIMEATAGTSYTLTVTRGQEGTSGVTIPDATNIICELTHEALDDVYGELLVAEKLISGNETFAVMDARVPDVNEVTIDTTNNKVMVGVDDATNTWEEFAIESHADFTDLASSEGHTQYYTDARAEAWHAALTNEHLDTLDHDHLLYPIANIRDLASEPSDTVEGGVYYNKTTFTIYYYDGTSWLQYNTVPPNAIIFRDDGVCPDGWTEKVAWNNYYLKGETTGVWTGGSGGSSTHVHGMTEVPAHAHTIPDRSITVTAIADHQHDMGGSSGSGSSYHRKASNYLTTAGSFSSGNHTHTITTPQHNTNSSGTSGAESQATSNELKSVSLTICEKN